MTNRNALEQWGYNVIAQYQARLASMLGFDLPYDVKVKVLSDDKFAEAFSSKSFGDPNGAAAFWDYDSKTIVVSATRMTKGDTGAMVHELTHAFQGDVKSRDNIEGLADYVRWKLNLTYPGWTLSPAAARFADMTTAQIRNTIARQSTVDGEDPVNASEGDTGDGNKTPDSRIDHIAKQIWKGFEGSETSGFTFDLADLTYTMKTIYANIVQNGGTEEQALAQVRHLALSRGGTLYDPNHPAVSADVTKAPKGSGNGDGTGSDTLTIDDIIGSGGGGADQNSKKDYLGMVTGSMPITQEIRQLAKKASDEQWTEAEFRFELSKTQTYQDDSSIGYKAALQNYGIDMTGNLKSLVSEAVSSGYTESEFLYFLRQTPEYRQRFKGIYDKQGDMRMSESEYINYEFNLQNLGKQYGYKVTSQDIGQSLRKGIMPEQFEDRLSALQRIRDYEPAMKAFQQTLRARGLMPPNSRDWTKQEQYDFVTGQSNPEFYKAWEEASAATAAATAGIDVVYKGKAEGYTDIKRGAILKVIKSMPGYQTEEQLAEGFDKLGEDLLTVLPLSEARTYGLTKRDLIAATFGGKNAAKARQKVKRVVQTHEAFQEDRANAGFGMTGEGRLGTPTPTAYSNQQSEY